MAYDESFTTEEIAKMLKVSKLTVYDLIKKGELNAYRVGRQMRIDQNELAQYKKRSREGGQVVDQAIPEVIRTNNSMKSANRRIVISGQDRSLDILAHRLESYSKSYAPLRSQRGSLDSLIAMYEGNADIVSTHLFDGDTFEYNIPYVRKLLVSKSFIVVRFIKRSAGLYVAKGNPKDIRTWQDLGNNGISIINREAGAGARVLLDEQLRLHHISKQSIAGYNNIEMSHLAIAGAVASGRADVGVGIEQTASLANIDFIPLITESYDLVMLKEQQNEELIRDTLSILKSKPLHNELSSLGYEITGIGDILYEQ